MPPKPKKMEDALEKTLLALQREVQIFFLFKKNPNVRGGNGKIAPGKVFFKKTTHDKFPKNPAVPFEI